MLCGKNNGCGKPHLKQNSLRTALPIIKLLYYEKRDPTRSNACF